MNDWKKPRRSEWAAIAEIDANGEVLLWTSIRLPSVTQWPTLSTKIQSDRDTSIPLPPY